MWSCGKKSSILRCLHSWVFHHSSWLLRRLRDSNPRYRFQYDGFQDRSIQPLWQASWGRELESNQRHDLFHRGTYRRLLRLALTVWAISSFEIFFMRWKWKVSILIFYRGAPWIETCDTKNHYVVLFWEVLWKLHGQGVHILNLAQSPPSKGDIYNCNKLYLPTCGPS